MTAVKLTASGMNEVLASVRAKAARARNLAPVLAVIAEQIATGIDDSFRQSMGFDGVPFAPNAASTAARKRSSKPAIDTGRFRGSVTAAPRGSSSVAFGTNTAYAGPVSFGSRRSGALKRASYAGGRKRERGTPWIVTVPARNPFPVTQGGQWIDQARGAFLRDKITRTLSGYIASGRVR